MHQSKRLGLALGGGAARGIAHAGVIKALCDNGIKIHAIAGTSAGSMVGGFYAAGLNPNYLVEQAKKLTWKDFASFHISRRGMFSSAPIEHFVHKHIGKKKFKDLEMPFVALATNILSGAPEMLMDPEMELAVAIRASSSFPGLYDPAELNGNYYCDGGAGANVPSKIVRNLGADVVLAVDVIPHMALDKLPRHMAGLVDRGLDLLLHHVSEITYSQADMVLEPVTEYLNSFHVKRGPKLIELGIKSVENNIEKIKALVA